MIYFLYGLSVMLMVAMPLALATWLGRQYRANWGLFGVGVAAFLGSQVGHIPFNRYVDRAGLLPDPAAGTAELIIVAAFLGVSAGVFEESARYAVYRWWVADARSWKDGMMLGTGHGGIESIALGLLLAVNVAALAGIRAGRFTSIVPADQWGLAVAQAEALVGGPLVLALLPAIERAFAIPLHLSLSLLVMQAFVRSERRWWFLAIGWHALANAITFLVAARFSIYLAEIVLGMMALLSITLIIRLRRVATPPPEVVDERVVALPRVITHPVLSDEKLDESRYS